MSASLRDVGSIATHVPVRVEGWLRVCSEDPEVGRWEKRYVTLSEDERRLRFFSDVESVLVPSPLQALIVGDPSGSSDGGFDATGCFQPALKSGTSSFTRSGRKFGEKVRQSIKRSRSLTRRSADVRSTKRLGIQEDVTKEEKELRRQSMASSPRSVHRSLDSLESCTSFGDPSTSINLAMQPYPHVAALHHSISPTDHCFFISFKEQILYLSAPSAEAQEVWIERISHQIKPLAHRHRNHVHDFSLRLTEVKGIRETGKGKGRYYCDVEVDGRLFGRTASKACQQEIAFWGDRFEISDFPHMKCITIKLYKDAGAPSPRQRSKSGQVHQAVYMGKVDVLTVEQVDGIEKESWFPVDQTPGVSMRIRSCYEEVTILPLDSYSDMSEYILKHPKEVCSEFEPYMDARAKEQLALTLLQILAGADLAVDFIVSMAMEEFNSLESETLIFRGNTFVSKLMDCHMRTTAMEYLITALKDTIGFIYDSEGDCEVDPAKLPVNFPASQMATNQSQLLILIEKVWCRIFSSHIDFPADLRRTLYELRQQLRSKDVSIARRVVTGSVFLRFLCPAILSPSAFQLSTVYPDEKVSRRLKLVGKVVQSMASFSKFGARESYLSFMNDFISKERSHMETFIDKVSSPAPATPAVTNPPFRSSSSSNLGNVPQINVERPHQVHLPSPVTRPRSHHTLSPESADDHSFIMAPGMEVKEDVIPRLPAPPGITCLPLSGVTIRRDLAFMHNLLQKQMSKLPTATKERMAPLPALVRLLSDDIHRPQPLTSQLSASQIIKSSSVDNLANICPTPVSGHSDRRISQEQLPHRRLSTNEEPDVKALLAKSLHFESVGNQAPRHRNGDTKAPVINRAQSARPSRLGPESSLKDLYESISCWHRRNLNIGQRPIVELPRSDLDAEVIFLRQQLADATILLSHTCACLGMFPESWEDGSFIPMPSSSGSSVRAFKVRQDQWKNHSIVGGPSAAAVRDKSMSASHEKSKGDSALKHLISSSGVSRASPPLDFGEMERPPTLLELARDAKTRRMSLDTTAANRVRSSDVNSGESSRGPSTASATASQQSTSTSRLSTASDTPLSESDAKAQMDALHQANAHFAASLGKHFKDFNDFQAVDDLLSLNASLAASGPPVKSNRTT